MQEQAGRRTQMRMGVAQVSVVSRRGRMGRARALIAVCQQQEMEVVEEGHATRTRWTWRRSRRIWRCRRARAMKMGLEMRRVKERMGKARARDGDGRRARSVVVARRLPPRCGRLPLSLWLCVCVRVSLYALACLRRSPSLSTSLYARRRVVTCPCPCPVPGWSGQYLCSSSSSSPYSRGARQCFSCLSFLSLVLCTLATCPVPYIIFSLSLSPSHAHIHSSQIIRTYTVHRALCYLLHSSFRAIVGPGFSTCMSIVPSVFPLITTSLLLRVLYV